jgi:hypothetical protein
MRVYRSVPPVAPNAGRQVWSAAVKNGNNQTLSGLLVESRCFLALFDAREFRLAPSGFEVARNKDDNQQLRMLQGVRNFGLPPGAGLHVAVEEDRRLVCQNGGKLFIEHLVEDRANPVADADEIPIRDEEVVLVSHVERKGLSRESQTGQVWIE